MGGGVAGYASDTMTASTPDPPANSPLGRRERNRRARERAYLDAALEIAVRDGVDSLTMTRLAAAVDAAVGTVYTYFPSKGALLAEIQRLAIERLTESYHQVRDRSEQELATWDDPRAAAVARLVVFGSFWVASTEAFPAEAGLLHRLISVPEAVIPPEEHHRVLPSALALLNEAYAAVVAAGEVGVIRQEEPLHLVVRWAGGLTGVLLTVNLNIPPELAFDAQVLACDLQRDLLLGWGAPPDLLDRALGHVTSLRSTGPLAPRVDEAD